MDAARPINSALRRAYLKCPDLNDYFTWIRDAEPCPVVILGRESRRQQNRSGELKWQRTNLRREARALGFDVLKTFGEVGSGWRWYRPVLQEAFAYARRRNAKLLTEAVNRYLRPDRYHSVHNPDADYEYEELQRLLSGAKGVPMLTYWHPDMPEREVHGHQIRRGKSKPAPRGATKARNDALRDEAELLRGQGYSQAEIARVLGTSDSNISRWNLESLFC